MAHLFPSLAAPSTAPALFVGEHALSYEQLARACAAHAARLCALGVAPGARVAVATQPSLETAVALVAHAAAGYVSVPIESKLGARELAHVLGDAEPAVAFAADPEPLRAAYGAVPMHAIEIDTRWDATLAAHREVDDAPLLVLYTSGTTGLPKGASITARNVAADLDGLVDAWGLGPLDTTVHALPLFHVHGLVLGLLGGIRRGGALAWVPRFSPQDIAAALREHARAPRRSALFAVPTMHHRLADAAEQSEEVRAGLRAAHLLVSGSAALPLRERERIERLSGKKVIERYGLTETLIVCAQRHDGERRAGTVGPPVPGVSLRLVDDARAPIDAGDPSAIGEVAISGPTVFAGYLNRPDATAAIVDEEGWLYTGDLATRDADGEVRIVGRRATDLIKSGGYKIGAGEVEGALLEHEGVAEAAVLGVPDDDLGERVVAFIVPRADLAEALDAQVLEDQVARLLSPHKRPREIRFVDALPRNAMGKVQKHRLRELLGETP